MNPEREEQLRSNAEKDPRSSEAWAVVDEVRAKAQSDARYAAFLYADRNAWKDRARRLERRLANLLREDTLRTVEGLRPPLEEEPSGASATAGGFVPVRIHGPESLRAGDTVRWRVGDMEHVRMFGAGDDPAAFSACIQRDMDEAARQEAQRSSSKVEVNRAAARPIPLTSIRGLSAWQSVDHGREGGPVWVRTIGKLGNEFVVAEILGGHLHLPNCSFRAWRPDQFDFSRGMQARANPPAHEFGNPALAVAVTLEEAMRRADKVLLDFGWELPDMKGAS